MRARVEILALIVLVVLIGIMLALSRHEDMAVFEQATPTLLVRSSYRTFPEGYKALYLTLQRLGYPVRRQLRPLAVLPERGLLLVADPYRKPYSELEMRTLREWVTNGNHALILFEHHPECLMGLSGTKPDATEDAAAPLPIPINQDFHIGDWVPNVARPMEQTATAVMPSFASRVAPSITTKAGVRLPTHRLVPDEIQRRIGTAVPLYRDADGVAVAYTPLGKGGFIWCTSPWSFSNHGISQPGNLAFIIALANLQPDAPIIFDEYHHGYGAGISVWTITPMLTRLGIGQMSLALLALLALLAWRFGAARLPTAERFTRSRAEYLTSMAGLLERAQATHVVRDRLEVMLRRELGRRLGLPPHAKPEQFIARNALSAVVDPAGLERAWRNFATLVAHQRPDPALILRLARDVFRLLHRR